MVGINFNICHVFVMASLCRFSSYYQYNKAPVKTQTPFPGCPPLWEKPQISPVFPQENPLFSLIKLVY